MEYILDQKQMQNVDSYSIESLNVSALFLMEQAAYGVEEEILKRYNVNKKILIVVEGGNNGGDGLALARLLKERKFEVLVYYIHGIAHVSDSFLEQKRLAEEKEVMITEEIPADESFDIAIDAIFGIGLKRVIKEEHAKVIGWMNRLNGYKIAVDIPSGIHASTGEILGVAFEADLTVTFGYNKLGLVLHPGAEYGGHVKVKDIGFPEESLWHAKPSYVSYGTGENAIKKAIKQYPKRKNRSNKGSNGNILIIAGSCGMAGAAYLAAKAAYRSGCGLVRIVTEASNRQILQIKLPEAVVLTYENISEAYRLIDQNWSWADSVLVGSGLSLSETAVGITRSVITYVNEKKGKMPVVVDGDSLTILAKYPDILKQYKELNSKWRSYLVLTPHLKEMSRLCDKNVEIIRNQLITTANSYIKNHHLQGEITLVLKDARTVVTDGVGVTYINMTGNQGMATAGAGDVLAGMLVSLLGQQEKRGGQEKKVKDNPFLPQMESMYMQTTCLAVCLHGSAGDVAKKQVGTAAMMANDIVDGIVTVMGYYDELEES